MAEIASAINGLITLSLHSRPAIQTHRLIENVRSAPDDMQILARELRELGLVFENLRKTLLAQELGGERLPLNLENVIGSCMGDFLQLGLLVKSHGIRADDGKLLRQWKKWRWALREKEVSALRAQLEAYKETLNSVLLSLTQWVFP